MRVFLIPTGADQYEPYCEVEGIAAGDDTPAPGGLAGLRHRFQAVIAAAERHQRAEAEAEAQHRPAGPRGWPRRVKSRFMRWIAERIAEQRLLWHLRREPAAVLVYPSDITPERAHSVLRAALQRDADRHLRWSLVDGSVLVASGILAIVPGPNLIAYYFAFRVVGHYFSWRGARHGLRGVTWTSEPSDPLRDLRHVRRLEPSARQACVRDIATRLALEHLPKFFERVAFKGA